MKEKIKVKKNIVPKIAVRGLMNGFVAYGILITFIFLTAVVLITWLIDNHKITVNQATIKYTLPVIAAIIIFFLVRATCRLSTFDLFKDCKIQKEEVNGVWTKMNFFYICIVAFSVATIIVYLLTRFNNERVQVNRDLAVYHQTNSTYARDKEEELIEEYESNRVTTLLQTITVEMGLLLGIFSLIPKQKKLIERYNEE